MTARDDAIRAAIYDNYSPAEQAEAVLAAVAATEPDVEVWVLEISALGPEPGDYEGWLSVHAGEDGALARLVSKLVEFGLGNVEPFGSSTGENGGLAGDYEADGVRVSYGLHRLPVEP